jgi:secondary thiamine-phosphate synthase enzyme
LLELTVQTAQRTCFVEITRQVQDAVAKLGVVDGAVLVHVPHTTAAVTVNEGADPDVVRDLEMLLSRLVPPEAGYRHAEGNSDAHVKSTLVGCSVVLPVGGGRLVLGTWQTVWFCEFDGPRRRRVIVQKM